MATPRPAAEASTTSNQLALALRTAELIERLTAENRVRALFDALETDRREDAVSHARAAGRSPERTYTAIVALPGGAEGALWEARLDAQAEERLRLLSANALIDIRRDGLRALAPLPRSSSPDGERLLELHQRLEQLGRRLGVAFGLGSPRSSLAEGRAALGEAADAARVTMALDAGGGARTHGGLGPYRFLVNLIDSAPPDRGHAEAFAQLAEQDRRRGTDLLRTLEAYLAARGVVRTTSETLFIHPNTLRQRLKRVEELTDLVLSDEDLLSLELSLKLYRLRGTGPSP